MEMAIKNVHFYVNGIVQGVGFRYYAMRHANKNNLKGYVKNTNDGRVEVEVEGDEVEINYFLSSLEVGPQMSEVKKINDLTEQEIKEYASFEIRF